MLVIAVIEGQELLIKTPSNELSLLNKESFTRGKTLTQKGFQQLMSRKKGIEAIFLQ